MTAAGLALALLLGSQTAAAQTVEYYHLDALGSVRAITNQSGAIIVRHDYLPFGEEWNPPPSSDRRMFTGKERDSETGFDYFGARYLAARLGRFTTVDPMLTLPENLADPQRWNRYSYVRNNPGRYTDPDGKAIDTLLDIGFLVYDVFDIARSLIRRESVSDTQMQALGADAVATVIPFATGAGMVVRAAARAEKAVQAAKSAQIGRTVLGHFPEYIGKASELGAQRFNIKPEIWAKMTPAQRWTANQKFLDRMIMRGDEIILATPATRAVPGSSFARELDYLKSKGFKPTSDGLRMLPPGR